MISKNLEEHIIQYFNMYVYGSARDIYFRLRRHFNYSTICEELDKLEKKGYLTHKIARATKHIRAHYVYFKNETKKEPLFKWLFKKLVNKVFQDS